MESPWWASHRRGGQSSLGRGLPWRRDSCELCDRAAFVSLTHCDRASIYTHGNDKRGFCCTFSKHLKISHAQEQGLQGLTLHLLFVKHSFISISLHLAGEILSTVDTHQVNNSYAAVSPCGRFVASSGWCPLTAKVH